MRRTLSVLPRISNSSAGQRRGYARVVGGIINQARPPAPTPQTTFTATSVKRKPDSWAHQGSHDITSKGNDSTGREPFHLDISKPPQTQHTDFRTVEEPPKLRPVQILYEYLQRAVSERAELVQSPSLRQLMHDLDNNANVEIPHVLQNGNTGSPALSLNEIAESVVTIAHILPPSQSNGTGEVILCSGFAILDGSLIATCTHPFFQINAHCKSYDAREQQANLSQAKTVIITNSGEILPITRLESHLVMSDVVLLQIPKDRALVPLKVSPYPCPAGNPIQVYNLHETALERDDRAKVKWSWRESEITLYQDRAGREAATGSYDELNTLLFDTVPSAGSSGGPILDRETKAVVGIVRGSEVSYAVRKERGFGTPAESLFNVFKLET